MAKGKGKLYRAQRALAAQIRAAKSLDGKPKRLVSERAAPEKCARRNDSKFRNP
jgi:hypothetical protein